MSEKIRKEIIKICGLWHFQRHIWIVLERTNKSIQIKEGEKNVFGHCRTISNWIFWRGSIYFFIETTNLISLGRRLAFWKLRFFLKEKDSGFWNASLYITQRLDLGKRHMGPMAPDDFWIPIKGKGKREREKED